MHDLCLILSFCNCLGRENDYSSQTCAITHGKWDKNRAGNDNFLYCASSLGIDIWQRQGYILCKILWLGGGDTKWRFRGKWKRWKTKENALKKASFWVINSKTFREWSSTAAIFFVVKLFSLNAKSEISLKVCVSDGATIVYTNKGDVMALYGYTTKKLGIRQYDVKKIQVLHRWNVSRIYLWELVFQGSG